MLFIHPWLCYSIDFLERNKVKIPLETPRCLNPPLLAFMVLFWGGLIKRVSFNFFCVYACCKKLFWNMKCTRSFSSFFSDDLSYRKGQECFDLSALFGITTQLASRILIRAKNCYSNKLDGVTHHTTMQKYSNLLFCISNLVQSFLGLSEPLNFRIS